MKRQTYFEPDADCDLSLNYCGTEICEPSFCMRPHIREEYLIHYILAGKGHYHTPQRSYELKSGDMFLIYPGQTVSYETDPQDPLQFSWFSFSGTRADKLPARLGFAQDACVRRLHSRFSIQEAILKCVDLPDREEGSCNQFLLLSHLYEIIGLIHESYLSDERGNSRGNIAREHIHRAEAYIKMNYMNPISVSDVVDFVGLERSYFSKIFHRYTGKTCQEYLLEVRIGQSRLLLEQTVYSAKEISSFVGFTDECYFSRAFRRMNGMSPKAYRENALTKGAALENRG